MNDPMDEAPEFGEDFWADVRSKALRSRVLAALYPGLTEDVCIAIDQGLIDLANQLAGADALPLDSPHRLLRFPKPEGEG